MQGYQLFFGTHTCNELCYKLGLERRDLNPASVLHTAKTPEAPKDPEGKAKRVSERVAGAAPGGGGEVRVSEAEAKQEGLANLSSARIAQLLVNKVTVRKFFPKYGYFEGEILKYDAERKLFSGLPPPTPRGLYCTCSLPFVSCPLEGYFRFSLLCSLIRGRGLRRDEIRGLEALLAKRFPPLVGWCAQGYWLLLWAAD